MSTAPDDMTPDEYQAALRIARASELNPYWYTSDNAMRLAKALRFCDRERELWIERCHDAEDDVEWQLEMQREYRSRAELAEKERDAYSETLLKVAAIVGDALQRKET